MSTSIRKLSKLQVTELVAEHNLLRADLLNLRAGLVFHADASTAISTADSTDLPTVIVLANACKASFNLHLASVCSASTGVGCHIAADATNVTTSADATDLTTVEALLVEMKADYNAHRILTASHPLADGLNIVTAAAATDLATSITLANQLKAKLNAHYAAAFVSQAIVLVDA